MLSNKIRMISLTLIDNRVRREKEVGQAGFHPSNCSQPPLGDDYPRTGSSPLPRHNMHSEQEYAIPCLSTCGPVLALVIPAKPIKAVGLDFRRFVERGGYFGLAG